MEQQEARNYVIQQLRLGTNKEEITKELSKHIGAPHNLVANFVNQVADSIPKDDSASMAVQATQENRPSINEIAEAPTSSGTTTSVKNGKGTDPLPTASINQRMESSSVNLPGDESESDQQKDIVPLQKLEAVILRRLKKLHRHNDIVQMVCEETGWSWDKAQRLVARTQTKNHHELMSSRRKYLVPFSGFFIIGGLLLLVWTVIALFDYYGGLTGSGTSTLPIDFIILVIGGFFTSLGIITGGIYGLIRALSNQ